MPTGTEIHNEICNRFRNTDYSQEFIIKYTDEGCSEINRIILEDIISNNNILIGYCDVVIDYEDFNGRNQKALIEVKSSAAVINKDPQEVLRQIKKYRFYNKNLTKTFLIYTSEESYDLVEDTGLFEDENITVVDIDGFVDSDKAEILARQTNERMKQEDEKTKKETEKKIFKTDVLNLRIRWGNALSQKINKEKNKSGIFSFCPLSSGEKGNSILIAAGGVVILIDAGLDKNELCKRIVSIGFSPNELFGIVIRHESFRNIQSAGYLSMAYNIPIFITPATLKACPDIHNFVKSPLLKELNCDTRYWIQDLAIEPFSISHVACDPIGLTLSWQNWKIGIAIDLGIVTNIVPQRLANCSLLYLESNYDQDLLNNSPYTNEEKQLIKSPIGHLSNTEAGLLLSQIVHKGLKYVILANINVQTNRPELALKAANESLKNSKAILSVVKPDGPIEKVNLVTEKVNLVKKESSEIIKSSIKKRNSLWSKATMWAKKRTRRGNARQQTDQQLK